MFIFHIVIRILLQTKTKNYKSIYSFDRSNNCKTNPTNLIIFNPPKSPSRFPRSKIKVDEQKFLNRFASTQPLSPPPFTNLSPPSPTSQANIAILEGNWAFVTWVSFLPSEPYPSRNRGGWCTRPTYRNAPPTREQISAAPGANDCSKFAGDGHADNEPSPGYIHATFHRLSGLRDSDCRLERILETSLLSPN